MWKLLAASALLGISLSAANSQPPMAQRQACEQDAFRLCEQFIPNENLVKQCLIRNMGRLSPVCRSAFRPAKGKKRR